jgi:thioesterase domain-containing protein
LPVHVILEALADEHGNAAAKYVPRPYQGDVVLFRVEKQLRGMVAGEHLGWKEILTGNLDVVDIPGHQQNLLHQPNISCLARELNGRLTAVQKQIVREPLQWLAVDDEIAC